MKSALWGVIGVVAGTAVTYLVLASASSGHVASDESPIPLIQEGDQIALIEREGKEGVVVRILSADDLKAIADARSTVDSGKVRERLHQHIKESIDANLSRPEFEDVKNQLIDNAGEVLAEYITTNDGLQPHIEEYTKRVKQLTTYYVVRANRDFLVLHSTRSETTKEVVVPLTQVRRIEQGGVFIIYE